MGSKRPKADSLSGWFPAGQSPFPLPLRAVVWSAGEERTGERGSWGALRPQPTAPRPGGGLPEEEPAIEATAPGWPERLAGPPTPGGSSRHLPGSQAVPRERPTPRPGSVVADNPCHHRLPGQGLQGTPTISASPPGSFKSRRETKEVLQGTGTKRK